MGGRTLDDLLVDLDEYDYSSINGENLAHEHALNEIAIELINQFKNNQAALFISVYSNYVLKLQLTARVHASSCSNIKPKKKEWVMTGIKRLFHNMLEVHGSKATKESKVLMYKKGDIHIMLHKALYRLYLLDKKSIESDDDLEDGNIELRSNDNVTLMCATQETNYRLKTQGKQLSQVYKEDPFQLSDLNFSKVVLDLDPYLWNQVCLETMSEKEKILLKGINFTWDKHIFIDCQDDNSKKRFVRRLIHLYHKLFILNDSNNYPMHIITANTIKQFSNSRRLMQILNRAGLCVSTDTLSRFHEGVAQHTKQNALKSFSDNSPIVVSVDNIDSLSPYAAVTTNNKNRCWHGTSVMAHQPLPTSDQLHPFENLTHTANKLFPIRVFGDGRCFFRCMAVNSLKSLFESERNMYGQAIGGNYHSVETLLADQIRSAVTKIIQDNLQQLMCLPSAQRQYYLEKRSGVQYESFKERIEDMKSTSTFAGPLEISVVAYSLKTQIHVYQIHNGSLSKVAQYPPHLFPDSSPLLLAYTPDVQGTPGHFNALFKGDSSDPSSIPWILPNDKMIHQSDPSSDDFFKEWADHNLSQAQTYCNPSLYDVLDVESVPVEHEKVIGVKSSFSKSKKFTVRLSESKMSRVGYSTPTYQELCFKTYIPQQITIDLFQPSVTELESLSTLSKDIFLYTLERLTIKTQSLDVPLPNLKCKFAFEDLQPCEKSKFAYLDVYDLKADCVETTKIVLDDLYRTFKISTKLNHLVVAGDIKTFEYIMKVKSECKHSMDWVIPYPGDWHVLFNYQDVLFKVFWDAGLKIIAKCTSLSTLITTGKFKKTHKFMLQAYEALYMYQIDCFLTELDKTGLETDDEIMSQKDIIGVLEKIVKKLDGANNNFSNVSDFISSQEEIKSKLIPSLWDKFEIWCTDKSARYETFAFWNRFIKKDVFAYIQLYLAIRSRNWDWRQAAIKHIATLMHAFDRHNYARWLLVHLGQMFALPSYVLDHFRKGGFSSSITGKSFSCIPFDEGHETLINKDTKKIIVKSTPDSIGRIASTLPYQAKLINNYESNLKGLKCNLEQRDFARSVVKQEQNNVFLYFDKWVEANIFKTDSKQLFQAFSNAIPDKDQAHDLLSYGEIGCTKVIDFVNGHIISTSSSKGSLFKRSNLKTFAPKRRTNRGMKNMEKERNLITRCYIRTLSLLQKGRSLPQNNLQFLETPRAICTKEGLPYKGRKSTVYSTFQKRYDESKYNCIVDVMKFKTNDVCLVAEGMNIIYKKPDKGHKYFIEYATSVFKKVVLPYFRSGYNDIRLLFDDFGSQGLSPKCIEQGRRDKTDDDEQESYTEINDKSELPPNWQKFLKVRKNKHLLCNYLFHKLPVIVQPYLSDAIKFIISGGFHHALSDNSATSICVRKDGIIPYVFSFKDTKIPQNHEESDTQIWLNVLDTLVKPCIFVLLTETFVLLDYHTSSDF